MVAIVPNIPVVLFKVVTPEICPAICKLETDKVLLALFHLKFADCKIDVAVFPINIRLLDNVVVPIPPLEIDNVPDDIFDEFTKNETDKVLDVLFHVKCGDCKIDVAAFPSNI